MITRKRVLLVASGSMLEQAVRFEGIKAIMDLKEVRYVWDCNKTPIMLKEFYYEYENCEVTAIEVPDELRDLNDFVTFCHGNGFECGEITKGQKFDTRKDECFLCNIGNHKGTVAEFNMTTPRLSDLIIYESENFFVKIELGCLIPGMVMINPKKHHYSAARIPQKHMDEYFEVMRDVEELLKATYGSEKKVIFFEHGSAPTGYSSHEKSIVHAHTHVAIGCEFPAEYLEMVQLRPVGDLKDLYKSKYMSYQVGCDGPLLAVNDPEVYVQRQYPRQVIGLLNGIAPEFTNWRVEPFWDNIIKTFDDILNCLQNGNVNERIIARTQGFVEGYLMREKA